MNAVLSNEQIQAYAPSAFATRPFHAQSSRYAFIPTSVVIDGMRNAGFLPVKASQSRSRIEGKSEFTKHMIRFRSAASVDQRAIVGDSVIEAVLINSHDGTSAYKLLCGMFRFVCSNGMVVADSLVGSVNIRHTGNVIEDVIGGTERILSNGARVMDVVNNWKQIGLSQPEQHLLAETAHSLRFPAEANGEQSNIAKTVTPDMLLSARRSEDNRPDLWHTFQRIQENSTKGFRTWSNRRRVTARAVNGIDGDVKLNAALWSMTEKFAALKAA